MFYLNTQNKLINSILAAWNAAQSLKKKVHVVQSEKGAKKKPSWKSLSNQPAKVLVHNIPYQYNWYQTQKKTQRIFQKKIIEKDLSTSTGTAIIELN